jgi:two-component system nitrogen regulation sensor histidine kinase NtrY
MDSSSERQSPPSQAPSQRPTPPLAAWAAAWIAVLALSLWLAQMLVAWLALAAVGAAGWSLLLSRRDAWRFATAVALWVAIGAAGGVQYRLREIAEGWPALQPRVEAEAAAQLNAALNGLVDSGERAVNGAATGEARPGSTRARFARVADVRLRTGVSALAVLDRRGMPMVWAGEHRGSIPAAVLDPSQRYVFLQGPLFSYLYFTRALPDGRTAVAAVLLESELPAGDGTVPFATRFAARSGLTPRFTTADKATGGSVWDWSTDRPILSVSFEALTQSNWWSRVTQRARWGVGGAWLLAMGLLTVGWYRRRSPAPGLPVAAVTLALLFAPLGEMLGAQELFSPVQFVLPLPWDVTLGTVLIVLVGGTLWLLIRSADRDPGRAWLPWWAQGAVGAAAAVLAFEVVRHSAAVGLRASHAGGGLALQVAMLLAVAVPLYLAFWLGRREEAPSRSAIPLLLVGLAAAVALALVLVSLWHPGQEIPWWGVASWAIPFACVARALSRLPTRYRSLRAWLVAGALASTVSLPALWILHVQAKLQTAEIELARLGTEPDPFLDFLLRTFSERARRFAATGEDGVNLLYHSWVASGLAREGYEARLDVWDGDRVDSELRLTGAAEMPAVVAGAVAEARGSDREVVARFTSVEGLHYLLLVPLPGGRVVSVAVPPRSRLSRATALARFLQSDTEMAATDVVESLYLVPLADTSAVAATFAGGRAAGVPWLRTDTGWRSEARAHFPSGWMHVHLFVRASTLLLLLVRGVLVGLLLLGYLVALWLLARLICAGLPPLPYAQTKWVMSFRGRLTLALFGFFLLPTAIFAAAAYQAVSREVVRSAAGVALRALDQTVTSVATIPLDRLGAEVGMDLLDYRDGALVDAAAPEAIALGLFDSWLPPQVFLTFAGGEDLEDWEIRRLGENQYVVGYRRFNSDEVYAAPIPLASEEIRRRQTEFRDVAVLLMLLGGALSIVLSLLVGRALTRPIDQLSRAAAAIGSGNLRVQLPQGRHDEFGTVYRSFNRMARRLRRARGALVRETRRTETIVAEAATGVLALDAEGCVELVNPRAEEILGASLAAGDPLPRTTALLAAVADAVARFRSSGAVESGDELDVEGRIVRLRLRRLSAGAHGGAVVALEDVTAEIRTTRVLAWGEMARQVAHEIKNPLTPIKLAVQHVRRAHQDGRRDFGEILERNVDAVLEEIDRLSEIARAFSRFGTPSAAASELESVDVVHAVNDTLTLYRGAGSGVRFRAEVSSADGVRAVARLGELKEVLVNLLENARDAVHGGGEVVVGVTPTADGEWVDVTVTDTGEGIDPDLLPRIFEPQFSTRTSGTGLGLAIVRRLVESWGGEATADSRPGAGTRVQIRLRANGKLA